VTAHLDSKRGSPGANDNASGVAVLIELARHFVSQPPPCCTLRFVALGAKELGLGGSRAYLLRHQTELHGCELVLNLDTVGGEGTIAVETQGGVTAGPEGKALSRIPAYLMDACWEDPDGAWRLVEPSILPSLQAACAPDWLVAGIERSAAGLGLQIQHASRLGSDQQIFAQAAIAATGITVLSNPTAPEGDTRARVRTKSLLATARLAAAIVDHTIARLCPPTR